MVDEKEPKSTPVAAASGAATTINFDTDAISRSRQRTRSDSVGATGLAGGVYHSRDLSRRGRSLSRISSEGRRGADVEEGSVDWRAIEEPKRKQVFKGTTLLWLAYQSVGVIYGDIGTSPLYVYSSTFSSAPNHDDILQVLSVILWTLTIMVTLKYVLIILRADNEGEGGTFSTYSLLTRYANLTERDPREQHMVRMERHKTNALRRSNRGIRNAFEKSKFLRGLLRVIGVLAVSMVMADGILTPAQSVLGAVQGAGVVNPNISSSAIVGSSCGILVVLFMIQPFGVTKLASVFAPIVILWLGFNGGFGIYNLIKYDHSVLKAFSPYFAFQFFISKKTEGWKMLGGILLSFTGVEALFADLGAFSMHAIQLSWLCYTFPCLLLSYSGQAAFMSVNPDAYSNSFYNSVPPGMLWPSLIVGVLAAIVASQAIITASFQLITQIMKLSYCPQIKVVHTSKTFQGHLFVPLFNWILMCGTILVTAVYSNTTALGNAYGVCVIFVTFFDTCMVTLVALIVWRLPPWIVAIPWLFFACVDGLYLSSALNKVPDGAWFTLMISGILTAVFLLWRFGKENQWRAEAADHFRPSALVMKDDSGNLKLTPRWGGDSLSVVRGLGIFFDKTGVLTPSVFTQFASKFSAVMDVTVFLHFHPIETPTIPDTERYAVSKFNTIPGCYRLVVRHGYMDEVISPDLAALIYEKVRSFVIRQAQAGQAIRSAEGDSSSHGSGIENVEAATDLAGKTKNDITPAKAGETSDSTAVASDKEKEIKKATSSGSENQTAISDRNARERLARKVAEKEPVELRDEAVAAEIARLDRAYATKIMYVVGKGQMKVKGDANFGRKVLLKTFLWLRDNTRTKIANLRLAMDRTVELGFVNEI